MIMPRGCSQLHRSGECACKPNRRPILVCVVCVKPCRHTFVGWQVRPGVPKVHSEDFECEECGNQRRWGLR